MNYNDRFLDPKPVSKTEYREHMEKYIDQFQIPVDEALKELEEQSKIHDQEVNDLSLEKMAEEADLKARLQSLSMKYKVLEKNLKSKQRETIKQMKSSIKKIKSEADEHTSICLSSIKAALLNDQDGD